MKISLLDYGVGNLPSVERAFQRLGVQTERISTSAGVANASALILPGVGHFGALIRALDRDGMRESLIAAIERGVPFLGICLGLQALFQKSEEAPDLQGLEILPGFVRGMSGAVKLPHMGWDQVQANARPRLLEGIESGAYFYFAHSYAVPYTDDEPMLETRATCSYGGEFVAVTEKENIFAVQFHPEKSGASGQRVLENFLRIAA
ncbi:MAG: imidazole glycerol-phosphate synthase subunit HisH [Acidobacteriaceae bacterium]|nr:imidazole glycerol-phosphate synthase subunit HisH [Acidobacteriaceae bacterium]